MYNAPPYFSLKNLGEKYVLYMAKYGTSEKQNGVISSLTGQNLESGILQGTDPHCPGGLILDKWQDIVFQNILKAKALKSV